MSVIAQIILIGLLGSAAVLLGLMMYLESKYPHLVNPPQPQQPAATEETDEISASAEIIPLKKAA